MGFKLLAIDGYIFKNEIIDIFILFYVNNFLIIGKNKTDINTFSRSLNGLFEIKNMGEVISFLGYTIIKNKLNRKIYLY